MTETHAVTLTRTYPATPAQVWSAWTDPDLLARWYGCRPDQLWTIHEWDVGVGRRLRISMDFEDERFEVTGEFLVVQPPDRLEYTFGDGITITVSITASDGDGTTVTVVHAGLPGDRSGDEMVGIVSDGWTSSLNQLGHVWDQPAPPRTTSPQSTEELVMTYWRSWQGGDPDWATMRACMADEIDTEAGVVPADQIVAMARGGNPWRDVELLDAIYADDRAALLYRGVDTVSDETMNVAEFLSVADGRIARLRGIIPMG